MSSPKWVSGLLVTLCASGVFGCRPTADVAPADRGAASSPARPRCDKLSRELTQLLDARDPAAFAAQHGLRYETGGVWVFFSLYRPTDDLAQRYNLQALVREGPKNMLALAPLATLCALARDERVYNVKRPSDEVLQWGLHASTQPAPATAQPRCGALRNNWLNQLLNTPEPERADFARAGSAEIVQGRISATIELKDSEGDLAQKYDLLVRGRSGKYLSALVPVARLCDLANDSRVLSVDNSGGMDLNGGK